MSLISELYGWWDLASFAIETQGTSGLEHPFGERPTGWLVLSPNGQMIALITAENREAGASDAEHAALFRSMLAYAGTFRIEDDKFITRVEASWNEAWTGTDQERFYKIDGDRLDIISAWAPHPMNADALPARGILSWRREA